MASRPFSQVLLEIDKRDTPVTEVTTLNSTLKKRKKVSNHLTTAPTLTIH